MSDSSSPPARSRWARFRFGVVAPLITAPPEPGELASSIAALAARSWPHPTTGEAFQISAKTIERWFYTARDAEQPIEALARKVPSHAGSHPTITALVLHELGELRRAHPRWSYRLVHDNLLAIARDKPQLGSWPSYTTVCRYMKHNGLAKRRKPRRHEQEPGFVPRERRSFEVAHVHALWHCDLHKAKRKVLTQSGEWKYAVLFGLLDDRSRVCCHAQWYLAEDTESFVHGLCQGFQKRGLPRGLLSDNGSPMLAAETQGGLVRLSIEHFTTLSQTPEQNGKQEVFWAQVEGRLMAMLEGEPVSLSSCSTAPPKPGSSKSTTAAFTARRARPHSIAGSMGPASVVPVHRAMLCAARFACRCPANNAPPTAHSLSQGCASKSPLPTARSCSSGACSSRSQCPAARQRAHVAP